MFDLQEMNQRLNVARVQYLSEGDTEVTFIMNKSDDSRFDDWFEADYAQEFEVDWDRDKSVISVGLFSKEKDAKGFIDNLKSDFKVTNVKIKRA